MAVTHERTRPVSAIVRGNLQKLRRLSGQASQVQLAERIRERTGRDVDPSWIAKIESGTKKDVSVDDVMVLAIALDVSPLRLMLPDTRDAARVTHVTEALAIDAEKLWLFCEQLEPWWDDSIPEETDPHGDRDRAWQLKRLVTGEIEWRRQEAERIAEASEGGFEGVLRRHRETIARTSVDDVVDAVSTEEERRAAQRERREVSRRQARVEQRLDELTSEIGALVSALTSDRGEQPGDTTDRR